MCNGEPVKQYPHDEHNSTGGRHGVEVVGPAAGGAACGRPERTLRVGAAWFPAPVLETYAHWSERGGVGTSVRRALSAMVAEARGALWRRVVLFRA